MTTRLAITGATGRLGGRVARRLANAGITQRLLVRDLAKAPQLEGAAAVVAPCSDAAAVERALAGLATVLMVSTSETPDRVAQHLAFVDAAKAAGVQQIVYVSFLGAAPEARRSRRLTGRARHTARRTDRSPPGSPRTRRSRRGSWRRSRPRSHG